LFGIGRTLAITWGEIFGPHMPDCRLLNRNGKLFEMARNALQNHSIGLQVQLKFLALFEQFRKDIADAT
jgi:hypothetical protein